MARRLLAHLSLERDYLYPEIDGLLAGVGPLVAAGLANGSALQRRTRALSRLAEQPAALQADFVKRLAELRAAVDRHLEQQEQCLLPKLRDSIRTEEREDLGQVFLDIRDELARSMDDPPAQLKRKRA